MRMTFPRPAARACIAFAALVALLMPALASAAGDSAPAWRGLTLNVFAAVVVLTLGITWFASRRMRAVAEFYTTGAAISGLQNGWAIAGDYLSAASFLGVVGLIAVYGFDGFLYSVGFLAGYVIVLLLIAEPCRNLGQYTLADILAARHRSRAVRVASALSALVVSVLYLSAQMLGGGLVLRLLTGLSAETCAWLVGVVTVGYVLLAGMATITYVQVVKAVMLVVMTALLVLLAWKPFGFSLAALLAGVKADAGVQAQVAAVLGHAGGGEDFLAPGLFFRQPLDRLSLCLALVLGTAGLPHILMRFFTVPSPAEARQSVMWAMGIVAVFYLLTLVLGLAAALRVGPQAILAFDPGANMAVPLLARQLGGGATSFAGNLLLALTAAVALTTIVAVVSGLLLSAAEAVAHDVYAKGIRGEADPQGERRLRVVVTLLVGVVSVALSLGGRHHNVAHWVALAFAVAASSNLPCLLLTLYWRRCSTAGVVAGMLVGTASAGLLILASPNMGAGHAWFPLMNPGLVSIPLGFLAVVVGSLLRPDARTEREWDAYRARRVTGIESD